MKEKILSSLLTVFALSTLQAQTNAVSGVPRLVVGITIDQLRSDYLEAFVNLYGEKGFKQLWKEGKVFTDVSYNFSEVDRASAIAAIYTGTTPFKNGVIAGQWLDRASLRPIDCTDDKDFMGYYTSECTSPKNLLVSTMTDELEIASKGDALVYAIAPYRDAAVLAAGHTADGAYWLNDETGKWCTSSYYGDSPRWLERYNDNDGVDLRINSLQWEPLHPLGAYDNPRGESDFSYGFVGERRYRKLKTSPCMNGEVNRLVKTIFENTKIGDDKVTDFLSVTYNAGAYHRETGHESDLEIQDTYARLDNDLAQLLSLIDEKVGLQHTLLFVTSTGYIEHLPLDYTLFRVPSGEFHMNRATALLNVYLMAVYGEGQYVEAYHDCQIYLNHKLLEDKRLNRKEVLEQCAVFLADLSGVQKVYTSYDFLLGEMSEEYKQKRNSFHHKHSGDLIVEVNAGWKVMNTNSREIQLIHNGHVGFPLFFMGSGIVAEIVGTPITTECIAPTLTRFMRIRAPSGSTEAAISVPPALPTK